MSPETQHVITTVRKYYNLPVGDPDRISVAGRPRLPEVAFDRRPFEEYQFKARQINKSHPQEVLDETTTILRDLSGDYPSLVLRLPLINPDSKLNRCPAPWLLAQMGRVDQNLQRFGKACVMAVGKGYLEDQEVQSEQLVIAFAAETLAIAAILNMPNYSDMGTEVALNVTPREAADFRFMAIKANPRSVLDVILKNRAHRERIPGLLRDRQQRLVEAK